MAYWVLDRSAKEISLANAIVHDGAGYLFGPDAAANIKTPAQPWANAVAFDLALPDDFVSTQEGVLVEVSLREAQGDISMGIAAEQGGFVAENQLAAANERAIVRLFAKPGTQPAQIVIRSGRAGGAQMCIDRISVLRANRRQESGGEYADLWSPIVHNNARAAPAVPTGVCVNVPAAPWAYAASFALPEVPVAIDRLVVIDANVRNVRGSPTLRVTGKSDTQVVADQQLSESDRQQTFNLLVEPGVEYGSLIVTNGPDAAPASVEIEDVFVRSIPLAPPGDELPPHPIRRVAPQEGWSRYYGNYAANPTEIVRARQFDLLDRPRPLQWLEPLRLMIYPQSDLSRAIYVSGVYEPEVLLLMQRRLSAGMTVFDIGANVGALTIVMAHAVGASGQVYSFEPSGREFAHLEENIHLNSLANVTPIKAAVGAQAGDAILRLADDRHAGQNTLGDSFAYEGVGSGRIETVPVITIDSFVYERQIERLDMMKIDVEGAELKTLAGGVKSLARWRPDLILEVSPRSLAANGSSVTGLYDLLAGYGYTCFEIDFEARIDETINLNANHSRNIFASANEA